MKNPFSTARLDSPVTQCYTEISPSPFPQLNLTIILTAGPGSNLEAKWPILGYLPQGVLFLIIFIFRIQLSYTRSLHTVLAEHIHLYTIELTSCAGRANNTIVFVCRLRYKRRDDQRRTYVRVRTCISVFEQSSAIKYT